MTELVAAARDRIAHIEGQITALSGELDELQTFIRVAERLAPAPVEVQIKPEPEPVPDMATVLTVAHEQAREPERIVKSEPPSAPASVQPTLKQLVGPLMDEHPDWTAAQIAEAIDRPRGSVAATMSVLRRERSSGAPDAVPFGTVVPASQQKPEPISTRPYREVSTKPITYPSGSHFRLRDVSGSYLHQSVMPGPDGNPLLTEDRTYAWQGTESQLVAVRKKLSGTIDMWVEPVIEAKPARAA